MKNSANLNESLDFYPVYMAHSDIYKQTSKDDAVKSQNVLHELSRTLYSQ